MEEYFRYKSFPVYKEALNFTKDIRHIAARFPKNETYNLCSQIIRAADSIALNIAEGSNRYTDLDFSRFLNQENASLSEVVACLDIAVINNYLTDKEVGPLLSAATLIFRQLTAFCAKVRKDSKKA